MRISLIVLNKIIIKGCSNYVNGTLNSGIRGSGPVRFDKHAVDVEDNVNKHMLGDEHDPAQWRFLVMKNASPKKGSEIDVKCNAFNRSVHHRH